MVAIPVRNNIAAVCLRQGKHTYAPVLAPPSRFSRRHVSSPPRPRSQAWKHCDIAIAASKACGIQGKPPHTKALFRRGECARLPKP